jgi:hypothetical protein
MDDFIDIKEGSRLTGYSEAWLRIMASRGEIEARKIGNAWALSRSSLLEFKRKREQGDGRYGPRSNVAK